MTKDERRAQVIEAALRLAGRIGPDRITAELIARDLGLTQPAIFRHFPRKDDIWTATVEWLEHTLAGVWSEAVAAADPALHLQALTDAHFRFIEAHPAVPLVLLSPELQTRHPAIRQIVARMTGLFHRRLAEAIAEGVRAGALGGGTAPDRSAWMMLTLVQGLALRWAASGAGFPILAEGRELIAIAVDGLSPAG